MTGQRSRRSSRAERPDPDRRAGEARRCPNGGPGRRPDRGCHSRAAGRLRRAPGVAAGAHRGAPAGRAQRSPRRSGRGVPGRPGEPRGRPARQRLVLRGRGRPADTDQEPGDPAAAAVRFGDTPGRHTRSRGGAAGAPSRVPALSRCWPRPWRSRRRAAVCSAAMPRRRQWRAGPGPCLRSDRRCPWPR